MTNSLLSLESLPYFTSEDFARASNLRIPSAKVALSRKTKSGEIVRIRKNLYAAAAVFERMETRAWFQLANLVQTPSYVSFLSALAHFQWSTQLPLSRVESCNPIRSRSFSVKGYELVYYYCRKEFYFGFQKQNGIFIAEPEKALLDSLYLLSLGRYAMDVSALDLRSCDWRKIERWRRVYSIRFRGFWTRWREDYERVH